jgi:general secretion pathway protein G
MKIHPSTAPLRRTAGFTLLEMVIVLGIIAMILGGSIFAMKGITGQAQIKQAEADFKTLANGLEMYRVLAGHYPTTAQGLRALHEKPSTSPIPRRWSRSLDKMPLDPWGSEYVYRFPGKKNPAEFEIISKGPDTQLDTQDDLSSQD